MCYEHDICEILGRNVHKNENWIWSVGNNKLDSLS